MAGRGDAELGVGGRGDDSWRRGSRGVAGREGGLLMEANIEVGLRSVWARPPGRISGSEAQPGLVILRGGCCEGASPLKGAMRES